MLQARTVFRTASLFLAAALQVLPVCRVATVSHCAAPISWGMILTWVAGSLALMGNHDAVSGASAGVSGLTKYNGATPVGLPTFQVSEAMGQPFRYRITVSNPGTDFDKNYFNCIPLPPGLTINTNLGAAGYISGTPLLAGTYAVTLVAGNLNFPTPATAPATITIYLPNTPPVFVSQPSDQSVLLGSNALFRGEMNGTPPFAYQWRHDSIPIPGQTNESIAIESVQSTDAGSYQLVVTNSFGSVTSSVARLTLREPLVVQLRLAQAGVSNGQFQFRVTGPAGTNYVISRSTDFRQWTPVQTNWVVDGLLKFSDAISAASGLRLYRATVTP